jgi:CRP-like cAMP-binding protein
MTELDSAVSRAQRVLALRTFPLFEELAPAELAALAQNVRPRFFTAGSDVLRRSVPVRSLHFVLRGSVQIARHDKPNQVVGAHGVVGGLAVLAQDADGQHAVAVEDTVTLQLDGDDLEELFEENFSILGAVLKVLAREQIRARQQLVPNAGFSRSGPTPPTLEVSELELVHKLIALRRTSDFAGARIQALADLAHEATPVAFQPGQQMWRVGDVANHLLVLVSGVIHGSAADRRIEFDVGPGSMIGLDSVAGEPRWYTALARDVVTALRIDSERLFDVIEDHLDVGTELLRTFARTTRELQSQLPLLDPEQPIA